MNITGTFCNILVICVCVMARRLVIEQENPHELEVLVGLAMKIMILWMWSHVVWEIGIKILENLLPPSSGWKTEPTDSLKMFLPIYQIIQHLTQDRPQLQENPFQYCDLYKWYSNTRKMKVVNFMYWFHLTECHIWNHNENYNRNHIKEDHF